ncbi:MAG: hypothetical protein JO153_09500 [Solirubrobacterales bacterium]|nr:hypothetical protein [Solirubrobacterales bacterium]
MAVRSESLDLDRIAPLALGLTVLASGLLLYHLTRGSSFWGDDWAWITTRRANTVHNFLSPYDGHLSVLPLAIYRLMFAVFGINSYAPYRALVIALSLAIGLLVFEYARHRVSQFLAMLVAALVLFVGPGWQDTMWTFQIGWELALGLGMGALIMLDRRTLGADIAACALTFGSICSTSFGVAFAVGIAVDVALTRRRWRDAWIPGIPLALYAVWALHYHPTGINWSEITLVPSNLAQTFAGGLAGIVGLSGATPLDPVGTNLTYGTPLLAVLAVVSVRSVVTRRFSVRAGTLLVVLIVFSALTTLGRAFETPLVSRYIYPDCVLIALYGVELARGARIAHVVQVCLAALAVIAVIANIGILRAGGGYLRMVGASTNADVAVLNLGRGSIPSGYIATQLPDYPYVAITAGSMFAAEDALGTPADSNQQLARVPATARAVADNELIGERAIVLSPGISPAAAGGAPPSVSSITEGFVTRSGACARFKPASVLRPGAVSSVALTLRPGAIRLIAGSAPVTLAVRRFGPTAATLGTVGPGRSAVVLVRRDSAGDPWQLELRGGAAVRACSLR